MNRSGISHNKSFTPQAYTGYTSYTYEQKDDLNSISNYCKNWYAIGRELIPPIGDKLANLIGSQVTLFYKVSGTNIKYEFKILPNIPFACVDLDKHIVMLPKYYFSKDFFTQYAPEISDPRYLSITLANGSLIHEALHAKYSKQPDIEHINELAKQNKINPRTLFTAISITEDLYIEACYYRTWGIYTQFLDNKNSVFFPSEMVEQTAQKFDGTIESAVNLLAGYKNRRLRNKNYFEPIESALNASGILAMMKVESQNYERTAAALAFIKCFINQNASEEQTNNDGESEEQAKMDGNTSLDKAIEKILDKAIEKILEMPSDDDNTPNKSFQEGMESVDEDINDILDKDGAGMLPKLKYVDILDAANDDKLMYTFRQYNGVPYDDTVNYGFIDDLLRAQVKNNFVGEKFTRGPKIAGNRLSRIITDQKIFYYPSKIDMIKPLEIILLVDSSGSMHRAYGGYTLFSKVLATAENVYTALSESRIHVKVYLHTSLETGDYLERPFLVLVADSNKSSCIKDRFKTAKNISLRENYDGAVLKELYKLNPPQDNARQLWIVLSDGQPSGLDGNRGGSAREEMKGIVDFIREDSNSKIQILGMSLVDSVVYHNTEIYGEDNQIDASENVREALTQTLRKVLLPS